MIITPAKGDPKLLVCVLIGTDLVHYLELRSAGYRLRLLIGQPIDDQKRDCVPAWLDPREAHLPNLYKLPRADDRNTFIGAFVYYCTPWHVRVGGVEGVFLPKQGLIHASPEP